MLFKIFVKFFETFFLLRNSGLRTLCMAMCVLNEDEYKKWKPGYYQASTAMEDREKLIEEEADKIEKVKRIN